MFFVKSRNKELRSHGLHRLNKLNYTRTQLCLKSLPKHFLWCQTAFSHYIGLIAEGKFGFLVSASVDFVAILEGTGVTCIYYVFLKFDFFL